LADGSHPTKPEIAKFLTPFTGKFLTTFDTECDFFRKVAPNWEALAAIAVPK